MDTRAVEASSNRTPERFKKRWLRVAEVVPNSQPIHSQCTSVIAVIWLASKPIQISNPARESPQELGFTGIPRLNLRITFLVKSGHPEHIYSHFGDSFSLFSRWQLPFRSPVFHGCEFQDANFFASGFLTDIPDFSGHDNRSSNSRVSRWQGFP